MSRADIRCEYYIGTHPDRVWEFLLTPEGTKQLFFGCVIESNFQIGEPFSYVGPGADGDRTVHVYGKILAYEPSKTFSFLEHPGPSYYSNHEELETRVTIELEQLGNCTKVSLVNDMWKEDHPGYEKAAQTWNIILSNLKSLAETGKTLDLGW